MHFTVTADTDVGTTKSTNQDSLMFKQAAYRGGEVLMAIVCDGLGGLSKGELASATVIRAFSSWFNESLPAKLERLNLQAIGDDWVRMLKDLNARIMQYGRANRLELGTTFTGVLFAGDQYVAVHVGDTRLYHIGSGLRQITEDQTFVAREMREGRMTPEQARVDRRRNKLLQCVGASPAVEPEVLTGWSESGAYLLCSDGFRHEISEDEIYESLNPINLINRTAMHSNVLYLIERVKKRGERDNISALLIKAE